MEKIKASARVECGYGTDSYDPETYECTHAPYCSLSEVMQNDEFWKTEFGGEYLSESVFNKYKLTWGFDTFLINVFEDDTFEVLDRNGKKVQND